MAYYNAFTLHSAATGDANGKSIECESYSVMSVQITGTFTGTVYFEGTLGATWVSLEAINVASGAKATSATAAGVYRMGIGGLKYARARLDWTSGTSITVLAGVSDAPDAMIQDVALAANSGVDIGDVDVLTIAAGETHIGEVGGNSVVHEVTLSLAAATYTQHDVLAATQVLTACMRKDGGTGVIHSIHLLDQDDQGMALDLVFLRTNVALGSEESAVSITDAHADEILGIVEILAGDYVDLINSQSVTKTNVGIVVDAAGGAGDLYIAAITRDTPTHTGSGITVKVGILRD